MKSIRTLLFLLAVSGSGLAVLAADPSPWDAWRLGYTNYELGESVRNRGDYSAALEAFEKSRKYYQAVKRARPDWNQKVIRERLLACDKQIAELRALMGSSAPVEITPPGAPPAKKSVADNRRIERSATDARYNAAQGKIAVLENELATLRADQRKKRDFEREMSKLTLDLRRERERSALLEKSCRRLQEELKKPDSALTELRSQLMKKHDQLENSERTIRSLEERLRHSEQRGMELTRDKKLLSNQLQQSTDEHSRLEREAVVLKDAVAQMREKDSKSAARIAELESALKEAEEGAKRGAPAGNSGEAANGEELMKLRSIVKSAEKRAIQFQSQTVAMQKENESLLKRLHTLELEHSKSEQERIAARGNAAKLTTRVEAVSAELTAARELQHRLEDDLKRAMTESEEQKKRLAQRDSDDFKALVEARSRQSAQENSINELKSRISDLELTLSEEKKSVAELQQRIGRSKQAMDKLIAEKASLTSELATISPDAEKFRELYPRYEKLTRNFEALRKENQENRIKLAAASPREAELKRIKLRLTELDRLKNSLGREQRLTAELTAAKKRLELELESMRGQGAELALAKKQLENLKALQREVQDLRKVNHDAVSRLDGMKKLEDELVAAKKTLIESGAAQLELHELKVAYAKALHERNAAATESARLRDELIAMENNLARERNAAAAATEDLRRKLADRENPVEHERDAVAAGPPAKPRDDLNKSGNVANNTGNAADDVNKHSVGLATQLEQSKQQLLSARQRIEQLETLIPQLEQLKKLNDELMHAKSFEAELIRARSALSELGRYKDELAGVIKLNETLVREKSELEKELARRPRLPQSEASEEQLKLIRAIRKEKPSDFIADGMLAESKDSVELAIWNYRKALSIDRENAEASELLGKLLLSRGDYKEAAQLLSVARSASPDRLDLALAVSRAYLGQKRFGNAQALVEPLLKQYPENGELLTVAALAFAEAGNAARAESCLRLALRYLPKGQEPRIELARLLIHQDSSRLEESSRLYEEARMLGARPDPELEPILGPRLDKRRELEAFMTSAMNEAFENRDYNGAVWYCRQLLELNRRPEYFTPMLALARYLGGENGAARETLTFNAETPYGALVLALIELKDGNRPAMSMALRRAVALNGAKQAVIDAHWRNLGFALDAVKTADPSVAKEFEQAYQWERAR